MKPVLRLLLLTLAACLGSLFASPNAQAFSWKTAPDEIFSGTLEDAGANGPSARAQCRINGWLNDDTTSVYAWNGQTYILQSTTRFIYDGWNLIAELDDQGDLIRGYVWGTDLSGTIQGAGGVGGLLLVYDAASGSTLAPYYDGNGNAMGYVDMGSEAVVADFAYGPFGEPIRATGPMVDVVVFRFSTKYTDAETGLLYYGYRYYDTESGRWLSRDPLGEFGGLNLYGFIWNDAINGTDYLGLFLITFDDGKSVPANILDFMAGYFGGLGQGTVNLGNAAARVPGNAYQSIKFGAGLATMDPVAQAQLVYAFRDIYSFAQLASSDPCFRQALLHHFKQQITDPDVLADLAANVTVDAALSALTLGLGKAAAAGKLGNYLDDLASLARKSGATNRIPTGLETRGVKIPGGRKINDTIPGSTKVTNSQGEVFKRVDNPPSRPHGGLESHTHPNFRNVSPDGTVRSGVSKEGIPQTHRDIIDAARDGAQRTGGL